MKKRANRILLSAYILGILLILATLVVLRVQLDGLI